MGQRSFQGSLGIAATDTESAWSKLCASATHVTVMAPATVESHTYTIEVTDDPDVTSPVVRTLQTDIATPANVTPPGSGLAKPMQELIGCVAFRINSDGSISSEAQATWHFSILEDY